MYCQHRCFISAQLYFIGVDNVTGVTGNEVRLPNHHDYQQDQRVLWYNITYFSSEPSPAPEYKVAEWDAGKGICCVIKPGYDVDNQTGDLLVLSVELVHEGFYTSVWEPEMDFKYTNLTVYSEFILIRIFLNLIYIYIQHV